MAGVSLVGTAVPPKSVGRDAIISGGEYVIVSRKIVTLPIVRVADGEDRLRPAAGDCGNFEYIAVYINDIKAVYEVRGKIIINN